MSRETQLVAKDSVAFHTQNTTQVLAQFLCDIPLSSLTYTCSPSFIQIGSGLGEL